MNKFLPPLLVVIASFAAAASAQQYPAKPIRVILPFAPGGPTDLLGRVVGQKMTESWGQSVVVESRTGANGVVASEFVARSAPDGYTLLIGTNGTHGINASLFPKLPYDSVNDFAPIGRIGFAPYVLVAHPSLPVRTAKDLIQLAKGAPGQIACAAGGSPSQLSGALFKSMAKIDLLLIPYKGNALAMVDLVGGQIQVLFDPVQTSLPQIRAGKVRPLAVTSKARFSELPDLPTVMESGYPNYEFVVWYAFIAPAATPAPLVARLNSEINKVLRDPEIKSRFAALGANLTESTPADCANFVRIEYAQWGKLFTDLGIKPE